MIKINMFSSATKVAGQGVGSAYTELIGLLTKYFPSEFDVKINHYNKSDISHYHTIDPQFYLSTFSPKRGRRIGYVHFLPGTMEGSLKIPQPFKGWFYKYLIRFYKKMDQLVVVNPSFIEKLVAYDIPRERIKYIPNFVSKKEFYQATPTQKAHWRDELHIPQDKFVVFGDGQVQERKGVRDFVTLAERNPQIQFIWAGGFSFGRMTSGYDYFKKVVADPPKNLIFTGIVKREDLLKYYNVADLFLLPSYDELFPMSVLEAFSCGTPVLLRNLDLYQAIIDGYYQPAKDVDEMDDAIKYLSVNQPKLHQLHEAAVAGSNEYSEQHLAEIWHDFYSEQAKLGQRK